MEKKLKVVTQNCFFGKKVKQIINLINTSQPDICCLQEVTGTFFADLVKKETSYDYFLSKPVKTFFPKLNFYNAVFTKLNILSSGELNWEKKRRKWIDSSAGKALWTVVKKGKNPILIYNCYFSVVDQGMVERRDMLVDIMKHANSFNTPVIICGDMNTTIPDNKFHKKVVRLWHRSPKPKVEIHGELTNKNEKHFFLEAARKYSYQELVDLNKNTWRLPFTKREAFDLKLDWMLYKGLKKESGYLGDWIGDHRTIIGNFQRQLWR